MRKVMVSRRVCNKDEASGRNVWVLEERGEALFHQFGVDYEEFESGIGNFSTAIVEFADGTVENIVVHLIKFLE